MSNTTNIPANHYMWEASDNCHTWPVRVTSGPTLDEAIIALRESYDFAGETDPVAVELWAPDVPGVEDGEDPRDDPDNVHRIVLRHDPNYPGRNGVTAEIAELEDGSPNAEWTDLWVRQSV